MIRFFKSPQPAALIVIPFIIIVLWVYNGWRSVPVTDGSSLAVWEMIASLFSALPSWLNFIFMAALISAQAIYFNLMVNRHEVLYKNSYLPSFVFALLISADPGLMQFHPVHVINLFVLIIFDRMFTVFKNEKANSALFDSAFLTGLSALIYFPALLLFIVLILSLSILRPFNLKEWLIALIGFLLPFFFISVYMFWNTSLIPFWSDYMAHFPDAAPAMDIAKTPSRMWLAIFIGSLLLISILKLRGNFSKNTIRTRSYQQIIFIYLFLGIISIGITRHIMPIHFAIIALPAALFIAYFYLSAKRRLRLYEISLWILIGLVVWNQF